MPGPGYALDETTGVPETNWEGVVRRRRAGFLLIFGALVPLAVAATAWACGVLATVKVDKAVARPGEQLRVTGVNYSSSADFTPVEIRWNGRTGEIIGQATPQPNGKIDTTVQVPANQPAGWYLVAGTQFRKSDGSPKSGTPGRTTMRVQGAAQGAASTWSSGPGGGAGVAVGGGPGGPPLLPTLLGIVLSLALLGTGLTLVSRSRTRTADRPLLGA